jgi:hypothetical protein
VKFLVYIEQGGLIPWGFGIAARDDYRRRAMCTPLPFNVVIRWAIEAYWWMRHPLPRGRAKLIREAYSRGFNEGLTRGQEMERSWWLRRAEKIRAEAAQR